MTYKDLNELLSSIGLTKENNFCRTITLPRVINRYTAIICYNMDTNCWQIKRNLITNKSELIASCFIGKIYNTEDIRTACNLREININLFKQE